MKTDQTSFPVIPGEELASVGTTRDVEVRTRAYERLRRAR